MICPLCSTLNREDANFCKKCGYSFRSGQPKAANVSENLQGTGTSENTFLAAAPNQKTLGKSSGTAEASENQIPENPQAQTLGTNASQQVNSTSGTAPSIGVPISAEEPPLQDPTFAPTQVVSHEQMAAYHARRVQQEQQSTLSASPEPQQSPVDIADMPTILMNPSSNEWPEPEPPPAEIGSEKNEETPIPPPPPPSSLPPTNTADTMAATDNVAGTAEGAPSEQDRDEQVREANEATGTTQAEQNAVEEQKLAATIAASQHTTPDAGASGTNASTNEEMIPANEKTPGESSGSAETSKDTFLAAAPEEKTLGKSSGSAETSEDEVPQTSVGQTDLAARQGGDLADRSEQPAQSNSLDQVNSTDSAEASPDFPVLPVGALVNNRYEVTEVLSDDPQEHVYHVNDHQGYQRCWNCGSEQNREGDEFCIDCGAELLNAAYILHEYPATNNSNAEAILQGTIVNTFVENGHTCVIEQEQAEQNAFPNGVHLLAAADSDAGDIRRSEPNEDSVLVLTFQRIHESLSTPSGVFIVADGMGGHDNGQLASHMAITAIAERMTRELLLAPLTAEKNGEEVKPLDENALVSLLQGAVEDANASICQVNAQKKTDMGSTITGFMIVGDHAYILNVGDSRTYMVRGGQIYQLTNDHSLVGQLVAGGLIQPDDVYTHPQRSQIFRSLGDKLNVQIDIFKQQLHPGDILLSCCDGLWEMVRNPEIENILNNAPDPQAACKQLLDAANANGGEDNISAVVAFVH